MAADGPVWRRLAAVFSRPTGVRLAGMAAAIPGAIVAAVILLDGPAQSLIAEGPNLDGHARLACTACHHPAPGTMRQQIQARLWFTLGLRRARPDFGYRKVASEDCLTCHDRPNERHPVYRFREPRFAAAKALVDATSCIGCHSEHAGQMVSVEMDFCQACHGDLVLKNDPLERRHDMLIAAREWTGCLGCHDFHGNHQAPPPTRPAGAHDLAAVANYLKRGPDPYGPGKIYRALSE